MLCPSVIHRMYQQFVTAVHLQHNLVVFFVPYFSWCTSGHHVSDKKLLGHLTITQQAHNNLVFVFAANILRRSLNLFQWLCCIFDLAQVIHLFILFWKQSYTYVNLHCREKIMCVCVCLWIWNSSHFKLVGCRSLKRLFDELEFSKAALYLRN